MPRHLIFFAIFLALFTAIFYHPIPDPDLWSQSDSRLVRPDLNGEKPELREIESPYGQGEYAGSLPVAGQLETTILAAE